MERLTLRAEAGSWPLWDDEQGDALDPADFELSAGLIADLDAWTMRLDAVDGWFEDEVERQRFDADGNAIWQRMSEALRGRVALSWGASFSSEVSSPPS